MSSTPASFPATANGTTISESDAESQAMWPSNACTSSTTIVSSRSAAVPHTPRPTGILVQARLALERAEHERIALQEIETGPVYAAEPREQQRRCVGGVRDRVRLACEQGTELDQKVVGHLCIHRDQASGSNFRAAPFMQ